MFYVFDEHCTRDILSFVCIGNPKFQFRIPLIYIIYIYVSVTISFTVNHYILLYLSMYVSILFLAVTIYYIMQILYATINQYIFIFASIQTNLAKLFPLVFWAIIVFLSAINNCAKHRIENWQFRSAHHVKLRAHPARNSQLQIDDGTVCILFDRPTCLPVAGTCTT